MPTAGNQEMDSELQSVCTRISNSGDCTSCRITHCDPAAMTSAEPNLLSPIRPPASATAVGISSKSSTPPVTAVPEDFLLFNAAMTSQTQPETIFCPQVNAPGPDVGLVACGGTPDITDRPREGPFNIHHDQQRSAASPQLLQETQGCLFRMTSYDVE